MSARRIPNDAPRADTAHDGEVHCRCACFDCTPEQVCEAVRAVGQDVGAVREHLPQRSA